MSEPKVDKKAFFPIMRVKPIHSGLPPEFEDEMIRAADSYNDEQYAAVSATGSTYVKAVAGCGKTRTLAGAAASVVYKGAPPKKVAVCSFTTIASSEIKGRTTMILEKLYKGRDMEDEIMSGTIHSLGRREIIDWNHPKKDFRIIGADEQEKVWKDAVSFAKVEAVKDSEMEFFTELCACYDYLRNLGLTREQTDLVVDVIWEKGIIYKEANGLKEEEKEDMYMQASKITEIYYTIKEQRKLIDYTDILLIWEEIIDTYQRYDERWECILVDEFQDTSPLQQRIIKKISDFGTKIIACGDPNQCITSFNGSDPEEQERLIEHICKNKLELVTNYRSDKSVLDIANTILDDCATQPLEDENKLFLNPREGAPKGTNPIMHEVQTVYTKGVHAQTEVDKAGVKETIKQALTMYNTFKQEGVEAPQVAILYRDNATGNEIEEEALDVATKDLNLPPFERRDRKKEAAVKKVEKELSHILNWWANPSGNKGKYLLNQILEGNYFPGMGSSKAHGVIDKMNGEITGINNVWRVLNKTMPDRSVAHMGYLIQAWEKATTLSLIESEEDSTMLSCKQAALALREFIQNLRSFETQNYKIDLEKASDDARHEDNFIKQVEQFGNKPLHLVLQSRNFAETNKEAKQNHENNYSGIVLSTIHLSKGKEYDGVVIHNIAEGSLPHYMALADEGYNDLGQLGVKILANSAKLLGDVNDGNKDIFKMMLQSKINEIYTLDKDELRNSNRNTRICNPMEEERRLLYVALTRAKQKIVMTKHRIGKNKNDIKELDYHRFFKTDVWEKLEKTKTIKNAKD